jgi:hypothetical protein
MYETCITNWTPWHVWIPSKGGSTAQEDFQAARLLPRILAKSNYLVGNTHQASPTGGSASMETCNETHMWQSGEDYLCWAISSHAIPPRDSSFAFENNVNHIASVPVLEHGQSTPSPGD